MRALIAVLWLCMACAGYGRRSLSTIPDHPSEAGAPTRGTPETARRLTDEDQIMVFRAIVRDFYRPFGGQVRWIDPRPLAHMRSVPADSLAPPDEDRAEDIVSAVGLRNVCVLGQGGACGGKPGVALRFSAAYAVTPDSAMVAVRHSPMPYGESGEMEFYMTRRGGSWRIAGKRTIGPVARPAP